MSDKAAELRIATAVAVFDLDGTLYDKRLLALRIVLRQMGNLRLLKAEREVRKQLSGIDFGSAGAFDKAFFGAVASRTGRSADAVKLWYEKSYMPTMVRVLERHYRLRPWVEPTLRELHGRGVRVAVFSDYTFVEAKLQALGFRPEWADAGIFDAPSLGGLKPCRESFLRLASAIGVAPSGITVIGDRADTDVEGARRSGMASVLV